MDLGAWAWRVLPYEAVPRLHAQGDCVFSPDGRTATLAVYTKSYRRTTLPWPLGGDGTADHREALNVFTLDVASQTVRRIATRPTDRRLFRGFGVQFEHRDGPVYYAAVGVRGPYDALSRTARAGLTVPRRRLLVRVDTRTGETDEVSGTEYARATACAESLRLSRFGRLVWNVEAGRWVDTWGPFRQIGERHVRSLRAPDSGHTVDDCTLLVVHEDPTQWDHPADPVEIARINVWPYHRR